MRDDFCAFILTHGRPDKVLTYRSRKLPDPADEGALQKWWSVLPFFKRRLWF